MFKAIKVLKELFPGKSSRSSGNARKLRKVGVRVTFMSLCTQTYSIANFSLTFALNVFSYIKFCLKFVPYTLNLYLDVISSISSNKVSSELKSQSTGFIHLN